MSIQIYWKRRGSFSNETLCSISHESGWLLESLHTEIRSTSATYSQLLLPLASCIVVQYIFISCWVSFRSFNAHIKFFSPSNNLIRNLQLIAYNWHLMPRIFSSFQFQKKSFFKSFTVNKEHESFFLFSSINTTLLY